MSVKNRMKEFISLQNLTVSGFEREFNLSNGYINNISKSIGIDVLNEILEKYSNLSIEWLLTGKGEMLRSSGVGSPVLTPPPPQIAISNQNCVERLADKDILIQAKEQVIQAQAQVIQAQAQTLTDNKNLILRIETHNVELIKDKKEIGKRLQELQASLEVLKKAENNKSTSQILNNINIAINSIYERCLLRI